MKKFILSIPSISYLFSIENIGISAEKHDKAIIEVTESMGKSIIMALTKDLNLVVPPSGNYALLNNSKVLELLEVPGQQPFLEENGW